MAAPRAREPAGLHLPLPPPGRAGEGVVLVIHTYIHGWGVSIDPTRTAYPKFNTPRRSSPSPTTCPGARARTYASSSWRRRHVRMMVVIMRKWGGLRWGRWGRGPCRTRTCRGGRRRSSCTGSSSSSSSGGCKRKGKKEAKKAKIHERRKEKKQRGYLLVVFLIWCRPQGVAAGGMGMHEAPKIEFVLVGAGRARLRGGGISLVSVPPAPQPRPDRSIWSPSPEGGHAQSTPGAPSHHLPAPS